MKFIIVEDGKLVQDTFKQILRKLSIKNNQRTILRKSDIKKRIGNPQSACRHTTGFPIPINQLSTVSLYTTPENPMNAIASRPAVIKAIGVPCIPFGTFTRLICSRSPAKSTSASPKPIAVENAYTTPVSRS